MKILLTICIKYLGDIHALRTNHHEKHSKLCIFIVECQNSEQSSGKKILMALGVIPLVILALCFLLSLGVIIYQRRLIQISNKQPCHKYEAPEKARRKEKFGTYLIFLNSACKTQSKSWSWRSLFSVYKSRSRYSICWTARIGTCPAQI